MYLKNKIAAAALCALVAVIIVLGEPSDSARAQTNNLTSATVATMTIAQMQQFILQLQQQITQILAILQQRTNNHIGQAAICGNGVCERGENAASCPQDCPDTYYCQRACNEQGFTGASSDSSANNVVRENWMQTCYCIKPSTSSCGNGTCESGENFTNCPQDCGGNGQTCAQTCAGKGYANSNCNMWAVGTQYPDPNAGCKSGQLNLGWTSDCTAAGITGGGRACCCATGTTTCGNGICDSGETAASCLQDCCNSKVGAKIVQIKAQIVALSAQLGYSGSCPTTSTTCELLKQQIAALQSQLTSLMTQCNNDLPVCGNGTCESGENVNNCPADCNTAACIGVNEGHQVNAGQSCCAGLTPLVEKYSHLTDNWNCLPMQNSRTLCAKCGNGICGPGESYCSCPQDCCTPGTVSGCKVCQTNPSQVWKDDNYRCSSGQVCKDGACVSLNSLSVSWGYPESYYSILKEGEIASGRSMVMLGMSVVTGNSAATLNKLTFNFDGNLSDFLKKIYVYKGGLDNLITTKDVSATGSTLEISGLNVTIPANYSVSILIQADVKDSISKTLPWNLHATVPLNSVVAVSASGANLTGPTDNLGQRYITFNRTSNVNCYDKCKASGFTSGVCGSASNGSTNEIGNYTNYGYTADCTQTVCWCKSPAACGNKLCESGETAASCPADCQTDANCKTLWWSDNTSKICQQNQFCGSFMYLGLKTYDTQSACQAELDATCSKECVAKGYALGGNYCVANSQGVLESCCCSGTSTSCKNLWWSDDTSKICQQKQFCGVYMYGSLRTYETQSACQAALDATCSKECVAKGYTLGGNYCVANEQGILESCCCSGQVTGR